MLTIPFFPTLRAGDHLCYRRIGYCTIANVKNGAAHDAERGGAQGGPRPRVCQQAGKYSRPSRLACIPVHKRCPPALRTIGNLTHRSHHTPATLSRICPERFHQARSRTGWAWQVGRSRASGAYGEVVRSRGKDSKKSVVRFLRVVVDGRPKPGSD
jgi:hypothetical protein